MTTTIELGGPAFDAPISHLTPQRAAATEPAS
ncbi:hypothetical protein HNP84_005905 [Thermocatellispora tengchongensis]|uniref:Uncharacterized protein n=1 Tax=Thermocatellispora tengchongensis TaxID=1073253 RepID=A0A840PE90_9ACTN|nr:hypothetical protein [Thermocatellispora tengchongensis]